MKTVEEWHNELYSSRHGQMELITVAEIKQIQLDAWKQGMSDAAEIVRMDTKPLRDMGDHGLANINENCVTQITNARDEKGEM